MFEDNALERGEVALHELEGPQFVPALRYEPNAGAGKRDVTGRTALRQEDPAAHGMTRAQLIILARLEHQRELSQNELAPIAEVVPITIARLIDRLEEHGMVKRCPDPEDRRIWRLTPAAAPILSEIGRFRARLLSAASRSIKPSVSKAMAVGLRQMKENLSCRD
jgi:MarR family transcriptional regulator, transcriptional regulator for hemolysin